jgi:hypothetical protein
MTQVSKIKAHLDAGKSITPVIAFAVYGIARLSSVIEDLRATGMEIDCILKFDETGKQYGEYRVRQPISVGSTVQIRRGYGVMLPYWVRRMKASTVVGIDRDACQVYFKAGKNAKSFWLNEQELVNAS